eukprot:3927310-Rhodomonas_salina.2
MHRVLVLKLPVLRVPRRSVFLRLPRPHLRSTTASTHHRAATSARSTAQRRRTQEERVWGGARGLEL